MIIFYASSTRFGRAGQLGIADVSHPFVPCAHSPSLHVAQPLASTAADRRTKQKNRNRGERPLSSKTMADFKTDEVDAAADAVADNLDRLATGKPLMSVVRNASFV